MLTNLLEKVMFVLARFIRNETMVYFDSVFIKSNEDVPEEIVYFAEKSDTDFKPSVFENQNDMKKFNQLVNDLVKDLTLQKG